MPSRRPTSDDPLLSVETRPRPSPKWERADDRLVTTLTIVAHPDPARVGNRATIDALDANQEIRVSRREPVFVAVRGETSAPLRDPYLSRTPVRLQRRNGTIAIDPAGTELCVDGRGVSSAIEVPAASLHRGVLLRLGERVSLLLHQSSAESPPTCELIGESVALNTVRQTIARIADLDVPVLLCGESGTGKELVAEAIHRHGGRAKGPWVAINIAAVTPNLVASELFGHSKGAFTGAEQSRQGVFVRSRGGTLFLDEIGHTAAEVQLALLRVLETHRFSSVGSDATQESDARVIAATDRDLHAAVEAGGFAAPLLHRLSGCVINLPPLRERQDDIARLLVHFLRQELVSVGESHRLADTTDAETPWLPAAVVEQLVRYAWPGNVRELRNLARQLVVASRGAPQLSLPANLAARVQPPQSIEEEVTKKKRPANITDADIEAALEAHDFSAADAARALGISRSSLYTLLERSGKIRQAKTIERSEIETSLAECQGDVTAAARKLGVSAHALRMRLRELGVD